ncbi:MULTISPECIES: CGNR zinc finger domain-containing protein [unclassified Kribbella]|uniref:CGNR zinc finger domain-containing protein n=1 Tax=unclassified Kribbella TaxID=2644121 RepID=UPI0033C9EA4F
MTSLPTDVALVHAFVNTLDLREFRRHGERLQPHDTLDSPTALRDWLRDHDLIENRQVTKAHLAQALRLRTAFRNGTKQTPGEATHLDLTLTVTVDPDSGVALSPAGAGVEAALTKLLLTAADLTARGRWTRLKMCPADDCHWIFYDQSRPGRARWCSPDRCGNRTKTRAYRERRT